MTDVARRFFSLSRLFQPRVTASPVSGADHLFLQWLCFVGLLVFASFLMWLANIWGVLVEADPTGITLMIMAVFAGSTVWVGLRAWGLMLERQSLDAWKTAAQSIASSTLPQQSDTAVHAYFLALIKKSRRHNDDNAQLTEVLAERLHGPSESAWWVNGIQIKLGLLGKVIGFSILAIEISQIQNFDASQSQTLLKTLTGGLGIALLTTAVGLVANMLLGVQLVRLDRCGDGILADSLELAETELATLTHQDSQ